MITSVNWCRFHGCDYYAADHTVTKDCDRVVLEERIAKYRWPETDEEWQAVQDLIVGRSQWDSANCFAIRRDKLWVYDASKGDRFWNKEEVNFIEGFETRPGWDEDVEPT